MNVASSVASGKSLSLKFSYTFARIVPFTSSSYAGLNCLIPTFWVALLTIRDGLASSPTWKKGLSIAFPFTKNFIASIPSTASVDVIFFVKLTGPLNSDGKFWFAPPPTRSVLRMNTSSNVIELESATSPNINSLGCALSPLKK